MSTPLAILQSQLDKANDAILKVMDGQSVWFGDTRVELSTLPEFEKFRDGLERKIAAAQRSASGRYGMSIKTASFS